MGKDKIVKVGILKDTYDVFDGDGFVLVVRTRNLGTQRMTLRKSEFIRLWYSPRETVRKTECPTNTYHDIGVLMGLPYPFDEALETFRIIPSTITRHCGRLARKKIQWVDRRKPRGGDRRYAIG